MTYRDRKYLSIIALTEDRDYVTYDELIHVLTERPSDTVYIKWNGILCGLVTYGDIARKHDEKTAVFRSIKNLPLFIQESIGVCGRFLKTKQILMLCRLFQKMDICWVTTYDGMI